MNGPTETPQEAARRLSASAIRGGYKPEALHTYTNRDGTPLHWRIRLKHPETGDKWIRPMRVNGVGFELGEPEYPDGKPFYRLHDIAARPHHPVIVVEGESCADALAKAGVLATTSGAADSAAAADWRPLAGRDATIWPDNDEAGQRYATEVAERLLALGCTVRVIDVEKLGLPKKGDAVDWLKANPAATAADIAEFQCVKAEAWPEPQPLTGKVAPESYPFDALPEIVRKAVTEVQGFTKAPMPLVASSALAALSLAIQTYIDVKRAERLSGPVGLFLLTIADSGERKSTCDGFFTKAIREYEEGEAEAAEPVLKDHKAVFEAWEAKCSGIKDRIRRLAKDNKPTVDMESALRDLEHDKPKPPRSPRLIYADATPEALAYGLAKQWPSGGVVSAEAGVVFGSHGMGKDSVMRNLGLLNQLWDGANLTIDRRSTESFTVRGARLTMALQVQEPTLRSFFDKSGELARGSGFLARFLVAWPESTQGFRPFTEAPENWPHLAAFHRRIAAILDQPVLIDDRGALTPPLLPMTTEAKAAWVAFHDTIEGELRKGGELYDVRDVASKTADNAARLAALFQVFEHGMGGAVGLEAFEGASRIVAWHLNESRRFFGELALPADLVDAARLDTWLIEYCRREWTLLVGKNYSRQHGPLRDGAALGAAIRELADFDRARLVKNGKRLTIHVNPTLVTGG